MSPTAKRLIPITIVVGVLLSILVGLRFPELASSPGTLILLVFVLVGGLVLMILDTSSRMWLSGLTLLSFGALVRHPLVVGAVARSAIPEAPLAIHALGTLALVLGGICWILSYCRTGTGSGARAA
jgi:hypothetical protein